MVWKFLLSIQISIVYSACKTVVLSVKKGCQKRRFKLKCKKLKQRKYYANGLVSVYSCLLEIHQNTTLDTSSINLFNPIGYI